MYDSDVTLYHQNLNYIQISSSAINVFIGVTRIVQNFPSQVFREAGRCRLTHALVLLPTLKESDRLAVNKNDFEK